MSVAYSSALVLATQEPVNLMHIGPAAGITAPGPIAAAVGQGAAAVASAAAHLEATAGKGKQTSLLTSALVERSSTGHSSIHARHISEDGSSPACLGQHEAPAKGPEPQLESVLTSWERAWMGFDTPPGMQRPVRSSGSLNGSKAQQSHGSSHPPTRGASFDDAGHLIETSQPSSTAPQQVPVVGSAPLPIAGSLGAKQLHSNGSSTLDAIAAAAAAAAAASSSNQGVGSTGRGGSLYSSGMMPLPSTPPPAHRPVTAVATNSTTVPLTTQTGFTPGIASAAGKAGSGIGAALGAKGRTAAPIAVQHPSISIPKGAKDSNDFASVFFSPLPYSYLNLARSSSTDMLLVNSAGSPDITLRGGRLSTATSITHVDWPVETDLASLSNGGGLSLLAGVSSSGSTLGTSAPGASSTASLQSIGRSLLGRGVAAGVATVPEDDSEGDVTQHGAQRRGSGESSHGGDGTVMGLVHQLMSARGRKAESLADKGEQDKPSPERPTVTATVTTLPSQDYSGPITIIRPLGASSSSSSGGAAAPTAAGSPSSTTSTSTLGQGQGPSTWGAASSSSSLPGGPTILKASPSFGRSGTPAAPPFSAHPAVASIIMPGGSGPLISGMDLTQSSGLPSIAAAAGEARPQSGNSTMAGQAAQHQKQDQPSPPATPTLPKPIAGQLPCAASTTSSASASSLSSGSGGVATGTGARLRLVAAAAMIPHVDKADKGGEDAYCIVPAGLGSIGVADGVSGWAEEGIDPAEYSRTLMRFCAEALQEAGGDADAREVIRYAHSSTVMPGSSTVSLAVMKPGGRLEVANLGDSGVRIIRNGMVIFASAAQQHQFNMPFQLSHPSIIESPDDADSADVSVVEVQPGDVIVMATDGLYDNMFDDEIARLCTEAMIACEKQLRVAVAAGPPVVIRGADAPPSPTALAAVAASTAAAAAAARTAAVHKPPRYTTEEAGALAHRIARTAHRYASDPYQRTPWSVASCEQGFAWARFFAKGGGKMDDCTVIVSLVQEDEEEVEEVEGASPTPSDGGKAGEDMTHGEGHGGGAAEPSSLIE